MNQEPALDLPNTTLKLLDDLGLAIDEARLVRIIIDLDTRAENIESRVGPSMRTQRLREEVNYLRTKLTFIRSKKAEISDQC